MTYKEISLALEYAYPGAQYTRCFTYEDLVATWDGTLNGEPVPSLETLQTAYAEAAAAAQQAALQKAMETQGGLGAVIASVEDTDFDRVLEPAKVRLGMALITKKLIEIGAVPATSEQRARLDSGILALFTHLQS